MTDFSSVLAVPDGDLHFERLRLFVDQRDAEDAVIDDALDEVREPGQQLLQVENRAHLAADLGQRLERLCVFALGLEQPGLDDRLRDVGGELPQDQLVAFGKRGASSLSRLTAPMTLPLFRSGTASCDFAPGTTSR